MHPIDPRSPARVLALVGVIALASAGCGRGDDPSAARPNPTPAGSPSAAAVTRSPIASPASTVAPSPGPTRNPAAVEDGVPYGPAIHPADFVAAVSHPWLPLVAGTTWRYAGAEDIEVTVTADAKSILGIPVTVVRDRVFEDGELVEDTLDWYAQDRWGNVWYMGEQTAEYKDGEVTTTAGSWEAGVDGAQPGIIMLGRPQVGDVYRQEFYAGEAEDMASVVALGGTIDVPYGTFTDVLATEEWTPLESGVRERKTYARGVGLVESRMIEGGEEVVRLVEVRAGG